MLEFVEIVCGGILGFMLPGLVSLRINGWNHSKDKLMEAYRDIYDCVRSGCDGLVQRGSV